MQDEEYAKSPESPGDGAFFLIDKGKGFSHAYTTLDTELGEMDKFPLPADFSTFDEYGNKARQWKTKLKSQNPDKKVYPLPSSAFYSRPPKYESSEARKIQKFTSRKNPKLDLSNKNIDELFSACITEDNLKENKLFTSPIPSVANTPYLQDYINTDFVWDSVHIPLEPKPGFYDSFEEYNSALINWTNYIKGLNLPPHPSDLALELHKDDSLSHTKRRLSSKSPEYKSKYRPQNIYKCNNFLRSLGEAYIQDILKADPPEEDDWRKVYTYSKARSQPKQIDEHIYMLEKHKDTVLKLINYGPSTPLNKPSASDRIETGLTYEGTKSLSKSEVFHQLIFSEYSIKTIRIALEKHLELIQPDDIHYLIKLCRDCTSDLLSAKLVYCIDALLNSPSKELYFDILLQNPEYVEGFCSFIGKFGYIPHIPAICYSLSHVRNVPFSNSFHHIVMSSYLYCIYEYFNQPNEIVSNIITKHFYNTAKILRREQSAIINGFRKNTAEREAAMQIIVLCLIIPYRPFAIAILNPAPIFIISSILDCQLEGTEEFVKHIITTFVHSDAMRSLVHDLLQFDLFIISAKPTLLVPFVCRCLQYIAQLNYPVITRSQMLTIFKCFTSKMDESCYPILHDLVPIFLNDELFLDRNSEEFSTDRTNLMNRITDIICQSDVRISYILFDSVADLMSLDSTMTVSSQFWMVFLGGLFSDNPVCKPCWNLFQKIFLSCNSHILPEFFEFQMISIFKVGSFKYCLQVLNFLANVSTGTDIEMLEKWFAGNEELLRQSFGLIYKVIISHGLNLDILDAYRKIITSDTGKTFLSIVKSEKLDRRINVV